MFVCVAEKKAATFSASLRLRKHQSRTDRSTKRNREFRTKFRHCEMTRVVFIVRCSPTAAFRRVDSLYLFLFLSPSHGFSSVQAFVAFLSFFLVFSHTHTHFGFSLSVSRSSSLSRSRFYTTDVLSVLTKVSVVLSSVGAVRLHSANNHCALRLLPFKSHALCSPRRSPNITRNPLDRRGGTWDAARLRQNHCEE